MKKILSLISLSLIALAASVQASEWSESAEQAMEQSKTEKKLLLMNFTGSDWCPPCKRMEKEIFSEDTFKDYAKDNLVLLKLDFPNKKPQSDALIAQNEALAKKFGIRGFPTILVMDENGELVGKLGYTKGGAPEFIKQIEAL